jgi:hypothetical protein
MHTVIIHLNASQLPPRLRELREPSAPFALRAKDITPFHSEEPNGATLPSAKENIQSKLAQTS